MSGSGVLAAAQVGAGASNPLSVPMVTKPSGAGSPAPAREQRGALRAESRFRIVPGWWPASRAWLPPAGGDPAAGDRGRRGQRLWALPPQCPGPSAVLLPASTHPVLWPPSVLATGPESVGTVPGSQGGVWESPRPRLGSEAPLGPLGPSTFRTWRGAGRGNWPGTFSRSDAEEGPGGLEGAPVAQALARLEPGLWRACFGKADPSPLAPAQCQEPGVETWVSAGRGLAMRRAPPLTCELPPGGPSRAVGGSGVAGDNDHVTAMLG